MLPAFHLSTVPARRPRGRRRRAATLAATALAVLGSLLAATPAEAVPGGKILGHRCRTYDNAVTNENTKAALADTAGVAGAACEIDVWTLRDGTPIVWHDSTWGRVANHATLPDGVAPGSKVSQATWPQVEDIRTKGGERVLRLQDMIDAAAEHGGVPLYAEIRNSVGRPGHWAAYARGLGVTLAYYQLPSGAGCSVGQVDKARREGALVGVKMPGSASACRKSDPAAWAAWLRSKGVSFVTEDRTKCTPEFLAAVGEIQVFARGSGALTSAELLRRGVDRLLVERPRDATRWPGT